MATKEQVIEKLKLCHDPELHLDLYTLGLIYNIEIKNDTVNILMTLTSPGCPFGSFIVDQVKQQVSSLEGIHNVNVELTFNPTWQPNDEVKAMLGIA